MVDSSEASVAENIVEYLKNMGIEVSVEPAPSDYVFSGVDGEVICIERARGSDFVGKVLSKRLWNQLEAELSVCDVLYYLIENPYLIRKTCQRMKRGDAVERAVLGAIASISGKARVIFAFRRDEVVMLIASLYERLSGKKKVYIGGRATRKMSVEEEAINMLMGIRGVGRVTAVKLLSRFGSVKGVCNAGVSDLMSVIGKGGKHVYEVVNAVVKD